MCSSLDTLEDRVDMKSDKTPGPWEVSFDNCAYCGGEWTITPPSGAHGQFANEADARLAAAAPDLLAACKGALDSANNATQLLNAICKAEGKKAAIEDFSS